MGLDAIDGWTLRATADAEADKGPFARMLGAPGRPCPGPAGQEPPPTESVRVHLDLYTREQARHIGRLTELGATRVEEWPYPPGADFVVMRDPDGNEFCVIDHPEL